MHKIIYITIIITSNNDAYKSIKMLKRAFPSINNDAYFTHLSVDYIIHYIKWLEDESAFYDIGCLLMREFWEELSFNTVLTVG